MLKRILAASAIVSAMAGAGPAFADISISESSYGAGKPNAIACFRAASQHSADRRQIDVCDVALDREDLSARDRAATFVNRGTLLMGHGNYNVALADFERAVRIHPELGDAYTHRGLAHLMLHNYQAAVEDITRGITLGATRPERAYYNRAMANEQLGNVRAAYNDYRRAAQLAPEWQLAQADLARFQVR
jgi:tetratricopeptide (TPR) repeat protein